MTTDPQSIVAELHRVYCALTGSSAKLMVWERDWLAFSQTGYTKEDLQSVLFWILRENKKLEKKYQRSVWLSKLIGDLRHFDDMLNEAQASNRNHKPATPKAQVLQQFRGMSEPEVNGAAKRVGDVIKGFVKP